MSRYIIDTDKHMSPFDGIVMTTLGCLEDADRALEDAYQRGLEDGKQTAVGAAELREKLEYRKGFKDGKAQVERGCEGCKYQVNKELTCPCSECANNYKNQWTAKDDKIVVGDEVVDKNGYKTIVTYTYGDLFDGLCSDGSTMTNLFLDDNHKTGRHFDIDKILDEMKGTGTDDDTY